MKDRFNREIDYLRISVTDKCNLRCRYCMPEEGVKFLKHQEMLTIEEYIEIIRVFKKLGVRKVRLTGGEPLVKKNIVELIRKIKALGIEEINLTTNGVLLKDMAKDLKDAGIQRVNISLDTLDPKKYRYITRNGDIKNVLEGIDACKKVGLTPIKVNAVIMRDFNLDEVRSLAQLTEDGIHVRFIELMPIGEARDRKDNYVSNEEIQRIIGDLTPIKAEDIHSPATYYQWKTNPGKIGFINPISCNFCENCNRVRLDCKGNLLMCLHATTFLDLKTPLRNHEDIERIIRKAIFEKPEAHHLLEGKYNDRTMNTIGG